MSETYLIWFLALGFPLFFVAMWLFIARLLSWFGWSKFLPTFAWDRPVPDQARRFSLATMVVGRFPGGVSYRNAITVWLDARGFYLRPMVLFRIFHPMLHVGWDAVASVEPRNTLWINAWQVAFRRDVPMLTFGGSAGQALFDAWQARGGGRSA